MTADSQPTAETAVGAGPHEPVPGGVVPPSGRARGSVAAKAGNGLRSQLQRADATGRIALLVREPNGRPSTRAIAFWTWNAIIGWVVFLCLQLLWMLIADAWTNSLHLAGLAITVLVAIVHVSIMPRWRYRVHRWEITDDAVFVRSGWLTQETRVAPIARLQTVDSRRGFLHRIYGLTTVTVTTASSAGALSIHALDDAVAREVVARLAAVAQQTKGDAT
ncbi:PH domain-containing protein [Planctomonas sp. JC2975]|uniref:PH domain-containing protein n=1 Tax=Planctomonas sp. JC2975 TaxID=2729626 RepID=UPI0014754131|nr:PH domain-containing protein [Planctomonas sp. JC2975]NNC11417.1 PH domain-containing protein [Planctomonas sp. JC2975]